jgi:endonuclease YncB( thermonuclease family)
MIPAEAVQFRCGTDFMGGKQVWPGGVAAERWMRKRERGRQRGVESEWFDSRPTVALVTVRPVGG